MRPLFSPPGMLRLLLTWCLAFLALAGAPARAELPTRPDGPVLDAAGIIPDDREAALIQQLTAYNKATGRALMVVTVPSLDGENVATYANNLGHAWGVGGKETDQGLILLVAPTERKVRIEVGYGLEEYLPDVLGGRIIREQITPAFKAGDYTGGISAGIDAIMAQLNRDPAEAKAVAEAAKAAEASRAKSQSGASEFGSAVFWIILILFFMFAFGRRGRAGSRYRRHGGIDPGIVLWGISEALHHRGRSGGSDWGGFGGGGGGGSDWGGFGGGDFGGGGASGDW